MAGVTAYLLIMGWADWLMTLGWLLRASLLLALLGTGAYVVIRRIVQPWKAEICVEEVARQENRKLPAVAYAIMRHVIRPWTRDAREEEVVQLVDEKLAVIVYQVMRRIVRSRETDFHDEAAARLVDRKWPDLFKGHVLSAVQLNDSIEAEQRSVESRELAKIGAARVVRDLAAKRLEGAIPTIWMMCLAVAALLLVAIATTTIVCCPSHSVVSLARTVCLLNVGYPTRTKITAVQPGNATVKEGQSLWLEVTAAGEIPETGAVRVTAADREPLDLTLLRAGDALFRVQLPRLDVDFGYQVELGDARPKAFRVTVLPQPRISVAVRVADERQETEGTNEAAAGGDATVMEGSHLYISAQSTKPLVQARFESEPRVPGVSAGVSGKQVLLPRIVATESYTYRLHVEDTEGVTNHPPRSYRVRVTPDLPPKIVLGAEGQTIEVLPEARAVLTYSATDDFGLDTIEMLFKLRRASQERSGNDGDTVPVANCQGERAVTGEFPWNLDKLSLEPGDTIQVHMRAYDTRSLGANVAESGSVTIHVVTREQLAQRYQEELARTVELHLTPIVDELRQLRTDTSTAASQSEVDARDARELADRQIAVNERTAEFDEQHWKRLAEWIQDNGAEEEEPFSQLVAARRQVHDLQEQQLGAAEKELETASDVDSEQPTAANLQQAADLQQEAGQALDEMADRVLPFAALARCKGDLRNILTAHTKTMNETRTCCAEQMATGHAPVSKTLQDLSEQQKDVHGEYVELDETLAQLAERPEMPEQVREAFETGRESAVGDSVAAASDDLEHGRTFQAFESQYDAYRGMLRQNATLQSSNRDRHAQADELVEKLEQLRDRQEDLRRKASTDQAVDDEQIAAEQNAAEWELQQAAEEASAIDAEAAHSLERALRQSAEASENLLAGNEEAAKRCQQTAEDEIASAQKRLQEHGDTSQKRPTADELLEQADYWKQTQQEAERLAREQEAVVSSETTGHEAQRDIGSA